MLSLFAKNDTSHPKNNTQMMMMIDDSNSIAYMRNNTPLHLDHQVNHLAPDAPQDQVGQWDQAVLPFQVVPCHPLDLHTWKTSSKIIRLHSHR